MLCARVCVCVCVCVRAVNLHAVGPEMHHNRLIFCGVANGSSHGPSRVVETKLVRVLWSWPFKPTKGLPMQTAQTLFCIEKDQAVAQDHSIVLSLPSITWPTWSKFKAFSWLFSVPWPGGWTHLMGGGGLG